MAKELKIVLRLNPDIPFERLLYERYEARPRSRRQEWLRAVLQAGIGVLDGYAATPAAVAATPSPAALPAPAPESVPPAPVAPARRRAAAASAQGPAQASTPVAPADLSSEPESASAILKGGGFFGESSPAP